MPELDATEVTKFIERQKQITQPLRTRMDNDFTKLWQPTGFKIGKVDDESYRTVTSNRARVWADKVSSELNAAKLFWTIPLGNDNKTQREREAMTERAAYGLLGIGDDNLRSQIQPSIQSQLSFHAPVRGWVALRCWLFEENEHGENKLYNDVAVFDPFTTYWTTDSKGLSHVAYCYWISESDANETYEGGKFKADSTGLVEVIDDWSRESNRVIIDKKIVDSQKNWCGYIPIYIMPVGSIPYIQSTIAKDTIKHVGESCFARVRDIVPILSEVLSYHLTSAAKGTHAPIVNEFDGSDGSSGAEFDANPYDTGAVINVDVSKKQKIYELFKPTTPQDANILYQMVESDFSIGTAPNVFYGQNPGQMTAQGTAMLIHAAMGALKDCNKAMEQAFTWLAGEMIRQYKNGKFDDGIQLQGVDDKEVPFSIKVKKDDLITDRTFITEFRNVVPSDEFQKSQMLLAYKSQGILSKQTTRDKSGLVPDTDAEQEVIDRELAEDMAEVKMFRLLKALIDEKDFVGAKVVWSKIQQIQAQTQPGNPQSAPGAPMAAPPNGLMPANPATNQFQMPMPTTPQDARLAQMGMVKGR